MYAPMTSFYPDQQRLEAAEIARSQLHVAREAMYAFCAAVRELADMNSWQSQGVRECNEQIRRVASEVGGQVSSVEDGLHDVQSTIAALMS